MSRVNLRRKGEARNGRKEYQQRASSFAAAAAYATADYTGSSAGTVSASTSQKETAKEPVSGDG